MLYANVVTVDLGVAVTAGISVARAIDLHVALVAMQAIDQAVSLVVMATDLAESLVAMATDLAESLVAMATDLAAAVAPPSTVAE